MSDTNKRSKILSNKGHESLMSNVFLTFVTSVPSSGNKILS